MGFILLGKVTANVKITPEVSSSFFYGLAVLVLRFGAIPIPPSQKKPIPISS
jgi:hypothetical protein